MTILPRAAAGIEHRREDGEIVGWIHEHGDQWVTADVLGRIVAVGVDWLAAEESLEERGLAWLADPWMLEGEGETPLRVRIVEVTPDGPRGPGRIVVKIDDFGAVGGEAAQRFVLEWPVPDRLRPPRAGDPDGFTMSG